MTMASAAHTPSPLLAAGLAALERGWSVFLCWWPADGRCGCPNPDCERAAKHPIGPLHPRGLHDATNDAATLAQWVERYPLANLAIRTGGGLAVVDVDGPDAMDRLLAACGGVVPETYTVNTGRGCHLYYEGTVRSLVGILAGVDTRGEGGYVIAWGTHVSGRRYAPEVELPLAPLPAAIAAIAAPRAPRASTPTPDQVIEGGRNDHLTSVAGTMRRRGLSEGAIFAALRVENGERCRPALDEKEVQRIAHSVARYPADDPTPTAAEQREGGPFPLLYGPDIAAPLPRFEWLCEELGMMKGRVIMMAAYGDSGKTFAAQELLLSVAAGTGRAWGGAAIGLSGPVVHVDYEQGRDITRWRYQRLAHGMGLDLAALGSALGLVSVCGYPLTDTARAEEHLVKLLSGKAAAIIDNLCAACPGVDENSAAIAAPLYMLGRVTDRTGCAIIMIHHEGKEPADQRQGRRKKAQRVRGHSSIHGALGGLVSFEKEEGGVFAIQQTKETMGEARPPRRFMLVDVGPVDANTRKTVGIRLEWVPDEQAAELANEDRQDDGARAAVLNGLSAHGSLTANQITKTSAYVRGNQTAKRRALEALEAEGVVAVRKEAKGAKVYSLV